MCLWTEIDEEKKYTTHYSMVVKAHTWAEPQHIDLLPRAERLAAGYNLYRIAVEPSRKSIPRLSVLSNVLSFVLMSYIYIYTTVIHTHTICIIHSGKCSLRSFQHSVSSPLEYYTANISTSSCVYVKHNIYG